MLLYAFFASKNIFGNKPDRTWLIYTAPLSRYFVLSNTGLWFVLAAFAQYQPIRDELCWCRWKIRCTFTNNPPKIMQISGQFQSAGIFGHVSSCADEDWYSETHPSASQFFIHDDHLRLRATLSSSKSDGIWTVNKFRGKKWLDS